MSEVYYNENEPYAVQWLKNLIYKGYLPKGEVDGRSIIDVGPSDLAGFRQCHFFAGIGGWALALQWAGWGDRPVWTGSCPCQPFSVAGSRQGFKDERHLWPAWFALIQKSCPATIFGEQVAAAKVWFESVCIDLESSDYAIGSAIIPAAGVGALHQRDRLWFVAQSNGQGQYAESVNAEMAKASQFDTDTDVSRLAIRQEKSRRVCETGREETSQSSERVGIAADSYSQQLWDESESSRGRTKTESQRNCWWDVEPGMGRVANGIPRRMGKLRAFGNAIVPQVGEQFIRAYLECRP